MLRWFLSVIRSNRLERLRSTNSTFTSTSVPWTPETFRVKLYSTLRQTPAQARESLSDQVLSVILSLLLVTWTESQAQPTRTVFHSRPCSLQVSKLVFIALCIGTITSYQDQNDSNTLYDFLTLTHNSLNKPHYENINSSTRSIHAESKFFIKWTCVKPE